MSNPRIPELPRITTPRPAMKLPVWNDADDITYHINVSDLIPAPADTTSITYNELNTYAEDDIVVFDDQLYVSLQNANTGNTPSASPLFWQLGVRVPSGLKDYQVGIYTEENVSVYVTYQGALRLARLVNTNRPFNSTNFLTELANGDWQLEGRELFRGYYTSLANLQAAVPTALAGDYAIVDAGVGTDAQKYIWDINDNDWIISGGAPVPFATESDDGTVQEGTTSQVNDAANTGNGSSGARLFVSIPKLWGWWTFVKGVAQTFLNLNLSGQIESGKQVGVYIRSSDGQLTKIPWLEYDLTNRKVIVKGINNLSSQSSFDIENSDGDKFEFFNDRRFSIPGTQFIIRVKDAVPSGNARMQLNDNQAMALIIEDKSGKEYVSFRSTDNDERFNVRVTQRLDVQGNNLIPYDITQPPQVTANAANGSTTLITSIPMNTDEEYAVVKCRWSCVNNAGVGGRGIVEGSVIRTSSGTVQDFGSQTVLDIKRTAGDFVMNIVADNVNKRININFVNNTSGGSAFRVTVHELSFVRLLEPV
jgi:hypothetical protein